MEDQDNTKEEGHRINWDEYFDSVLTILGSGKAYVLISVERKEQINNIQILGVAPDLNQLDFTLAASKKTYPDYTG